MDQLKKEDYLAIINSIHDGLYFVDENRKIIFWNDAAERISGFSEEEVVGKCCADSILTHIDVDGNYLCEQGCPLQVTMDDKQAHEDTVYLHHKKGHRIPIHVRTSPLIDSQGNVTGAIELFTDISNQEANAMRVKELEKLALLDTLTNLANRRYLEQEIHIRLSELDRFNVPFGLFFMDIDYFKKINDKYGHEIGDEILRYTSKTFVVNSRPFDLYGRWGGEEFVAIIRNVNEKELRGIAERVRRLVERSYIIHHGRKIMVTLSIGATMAVQSDSVKSVINRADENMYQGKQEGRNKVVFR
ncbi:MAG: diguanylate cyclase [Desulfocapsaceae bacterium]|nr:diguanylate cyclase [Desulfocapsaceae bacterium]